MKLEYTDGCICTSLTVDDIETIDMDIEAFKNVIKKFLIYGQKNDIKMLIECLHQLIKEGYYEEYNGDEDFNVPDNANYYICHINGKEYEYTEFFNKGTVYDIISINKNICDNNFTEEMYKDMCYLIDRITDVAVLQTIFCHVMERCGVCESSSRPCECCGDYIYHYSLTMD